MTASGSLPERLDAAIASQRLQARVAADVARHHLDRDQFGSAQRHLSEAARHRFVADLLAEAARPTSAKGYFPPMDLRERLTEVEEVHARGAQVVTDAARRFLDEGAPHVAADFLESATKHALLIAVLNEVTGQESSADSDDD